MKYITCKHDKFVNALTKAFGFTAACSNLRLVDNVT